MTPESICCRLCDQVIADFDPRFHHLPIDKTHAANICSRCGKAFSVWQQQKLASLFPSPLAKKRFPKG